jgi:hypothetical protein
MGNLDFVLHQFVSFLSFNFSKEITVNRDEVYLLVVEFDFFAITGFLYKSFDFKVLIFLENLPHLLSGKDEIFLFLKPLLE